MYVLMRVCMYVRECVCVCVYIYIYINILDEHAASNFRIQV